MIRNDAFVLRNIRNIYFLVPTKTNNVGQNIYNLNQLAVTIWNEIENYSDLNSLVKGVVTKYELSNVEEEVRSFINNIAQIGLMKIS